MTNDSGAHTAVLIIWPIINVAIRSANDICKFNVPNLDPAN